MSHFNDKVAIVTGGGSGIGRALCEELGQRWTIVILADIDTERAREAAAGIAGAGGDAHAVQVDVSKEGEIQGLVGQAITDLGRLDYMFNNAGIGLGGEVRDMSAADWDRVFEVNLQGVVYGTRAAYSVMVRQGSGHIINTASMAGLIGVPMTVPYTVTKFGVVGLSTALRAEARGLGVKVSVVCPGFVRTDIFSCSQVINVDKEELIDRVPFKPMEPVQAAKIILRGVQRNRAIIVFPFVARLFWWLYRIHPVLVSPMTRKMVRDFRSIRTEN